MMAEYIDHMGDDLSVINAAKVSFDNMDDHWVSEEEAEALGVKSHSGLIRYLAKHDHWTPFAHTAIKLRMQAPVPIRTQCFKHKQGLVENEESRRYIRSRPVLFVPNAFRSKPEGSIKQGSGGAHPSSGIWLEHYKNKCQSMIDLYMEMIEDDVCPEQARFVLPQGCEVNWIWTGNLYAFANFVNKRTYPTAQLEARVLAQAVSEIVQPLFPVAWAALTGGAA